MAYSIVSKPPVGFFFKVEIKGISEENSFQEVSGLSYDMKTEEILAGGEIIPYKVPKTVSFPNLVLKRGLVVPKSKLLTWCYESSQVAVGNPIKLKDIQVQLLQKKNDSSQKVIFKWDLKKAYPVKFQSSGLGAEKNEIVIETIELSYREWAIQDTAP